MIKLLIIVTISVGILNETAFAQHDSDAYSGNIIFLPGLFCKRTVAVVLPLQVGGKKNRYVIADNKSEIKPLKSFLNLHGNIFYSYNYNGSIDTPYAQKDVTQHITQIYLTGFIRQKYPFRVYLTNRVSNTSFIPSLTDISFQFNQRQFNSEIQQNIKKELARLEKLREEHLILEKTYALKLDELKKLKKEISINGNMQKLVEKKEQQFLKEQEKANINNELISVSDSLIRKLPLTDLNKDSLQNTSGLVEIFKKESDLSESLKGDINAVNLHDKKQLTGPIYKTDTTLKRYNDSVKAKFQQEHGIQSLDSLSNYNDLIAAEKVKKLEEEITDLKSRYQRSINKYNIDTVSIASFLDSSVSSAKLKQKLRSLNLNDSGLPKGYRFWYALKSFALGRINIDYSELSAKNISITGIALAYHPSFYIAIAAGIIDYRFRDYIIKDRETGKAQYLNIIRIGTKSQDLSSFIITFYQGRRQLYNALSATTSGSGNYNLHGFTIEKKMTLGRYTIISAEIAKSSLPYYEQNNNKAMVSVLNFNDHTNEAYALNLRSFIPATSTKISLGFKHTAANFQSFSVFTSGSSQTSYSAKVDQMFFKKKILVSGSVKANDFSNPYIGKDYRSYNVFAGLQATVRVKKWPVISIGYFPNSQLTKTAADKFIENNFYTLTANANYFYTYGRIACNTSLVYNQFYNTASDSGFIYFNTKNLMLNQTFFIARLTFNTLLSVTQNNSYKLYTLGSTADYKLNKLTVGAGIKYNRQATHSISKLGFTANISTAVKRVGVFTACFDKGFVVSENNNLRENSTATITFYKTF